MYIAGVYNPVLGATILDDIRNEEVRKILTSFYNSKCSCYSAVFYDRIDIIIDNSVIYRTTLKTPPSIELPNLYIDAEMLLKEVPEDKMINCPWVEQNYNFTIQRLQLGKMVGGKSNLRDDPEFEDLINMKSDKGMKLYKIPGFDKNKVYMIPVFSGFPSLNKQDTADVEIYEYNQTSVIVSMKIFKKKLNRDVYMIYKILDIT
ncbi:MAG: hypothetical protein IKR19_07555 [Acholeplasmatales bacterium]|nr:hypothetical protein [Acholeplasmatales bacterium]